MSQETKLETKRAQIETKHTPADFREKFWSHQLFVIFKTSENIRGNVGVISIILRTFLDDTEILLEWLLKKQQ